MKDFEQYLQEQHALDYIGLGDDMLDDFDIWISQLDGSEFIQFADDFADEIRKELNANK